MHPLSCCCEAIPGQKPGASSQVSFCSSDWDFMRAQTIVIVHVLHSGKNKGLFTPGEDSALKIELGNEKIKALS